MAKAKARAQEAGSQAFTHLDQDKLDEILQMARQDKRRRLANSQSSSDPTQDEQDEDEEDHEM